MKDIQAGVVLVQKFCQSDSHVFSKYIDYIAREEAVRRRNETTFNLFSDYVGHYMDNREKTTGIFTADKDRLTLEEKEKLKELYLRACEKGSLMWQTVISFDNRWLEENGVYREGILNEEKIREVARSGMNLMLQKEGLEEGIWSATIHYNTDNIHIHFATVELQPLRPTILKEGRKEYRGKFKQSSFEAAKSVIVNGIIQNPEINQRITSLIRNNILKHPIAFQQAEQRIQEAYLSIYHQLDGVPIRFWKYNMNRISHLRDEIDDLSRLYIKSYLQEEYRQLEEILKEQEDRYRKGYGSGGSFQYGTNKKKDLLERMGNRILKEMRQLHQSLEQEESHRLGQLDEFLEEEVANLPPEEHSLGWQAFVSQDYFEGKKAYHLYQGKDGRLKDLEKVYQQGNITAGLYLAKQVNLERKKEIYQEILPRILHLYEQSEGFLTDYLGYQLGQIYHTQQDVGQAKIYYEASRLSVSTYQLGKIFIQEDRERSKQLFEEIVAKLPPSGEKKDLISGLAFYQLGKLWERENDTKAYFYYQQAHSILESSFSAIKLGNMNYQGRGCSINPKAAYGYFWYAREKYHQEGKRPPLFIEAMLEKIKEGDMEARSKSVTRQARRQTILPSIFQLKKYFRSDMKAIKRNIQEYDDMLEKQIKNTSEIIY